MTTIQKDQAMFHIKRQRKRKTRHAPPYTQSGKPPVVKEYDKPKRDQFTPPMWPSTPR